MWRRRLGPFLVIFGLTAAWLLLSMVEDVNIYDEGLILTGAARVLDGDVIHRDFYANYGPAQFYSLAGLFKLFGPSVLVERLWDTAIRSLIVCLIYAIVHRSAGQRLAVATSIVAAIWCAVVYGLGYPLMPAFAAVLAGAVLILPSFEGAAARGRLRAAGFCAAVAMLFRYDIGLADAAVIVAILVAYAGANGADSRPLTSRLVDSVGNYLLGFVALAFPAVVVFAVYGVLPGLYDDMAFLARHYSGTRSGPFPKITEHHLSAILLVPLLVCLVALPALRRLAVARVPTFWPMLLLLSLTLLFFAKGYVRPSYVQLSAAILCSLMLLALVVAMMPQLGRLNRGILLGLMGLVLVLTLGALPQTVPRIHRSLAILAAGGCHSPAGLERLSCFEIAWDEANAIRYVEHRTHPGDFTFSGTGRHDKIFDNDNLFYFLAKLRPATKWHHFDPLLQNQAAIQTEMRDELARNCPRFIMLDTEWDNYYEHNDSALSSGVTILDDYIRGHYTAATRFGADIVLSMDPSGCSPAKTKP